MYMQLATCGHALQRSSNRLGVPQCMVTFYTIIAIGVFAVRTDLRQTVGLLNVTSPCRTVIVVISRKQRKIET